MLLLISNQQINQQSIIIFSLILTVIIQLAIKYLIDNIRQPTKEDKITKRRSLPLRLLTTIHQIIVEVIRTQTITCIDRII